jgi:hypothetical protein
MAVRPIQARCRRCQQVFHLFELLDDRSGRCPRCSSALTPDWAQELIRQAATADIAQRQLVVALRGLRNIPGNVTLLPHTVLGNLFTEVGWERDLAVEPDLLQYEISELRSLLGAWQRLEPAALESTPSRGWLRRAFDLLTRRRHSPITPAPTSAEHAATDAANGAIVTSCESADIAA